MRQGDNLLPGQLGAIAVSAASLTLPLICGLLYPGATTVISMAPSDTPAHNPQPEQRSSRNTRSTVGDPFTGSPTFRQRRIPSATLPRNCQIGRSACRERVCQSVMIVVGGVS